MKKTIAILSTAILMSCVGGANTPEHGSNTPEPRTIDKVLSLKDAERIGISRQITSNKKIRWCIHLDVNTIDLIGCGDTLEKAYDDLRESCETICNVIN